MKKILIFFVSLFFCFSVNAQKKESEYQIKKVSAKILDSKIFAETIKKAEFKVADSVEIISSDFDYFIDDDGAFTLPSITFTLDEGRELFYEGKETWKSKEKEIDGYVFSSSSGQRLLFTEKNSGRFVFTHLKDEEETYEIVDNNLAINCKYHQTNRIIKIE